jgi:molybdenum cofactor biosynthesis enzyme MoaA
MGGKEQMEKNRVLIWGAGLRGKEAYRLFDRHNGYEVVAFGDNNKMLWGKTVCQKPIIGPMDVVKNKEIDSIFIASSYAEEIKLQLKELVDIPVFDNIDDLVIGRISIDISGYCNAMCKWCVTGRKNRENSGRQALYMSYVEFVKVYEHLFQNGMIGKDTEIMLYNWGEPFLNKDYVHIIQYLTDQEQNFAISTNASKVTILEHKDAYKHCSTFIFSMPGFSQESYDRIHGFSFEQIKKNIKELCKNIKETGFTGSGMLSFHVYKFNKHEIGKAKEFAESLGLKFYCYYPYFAGNSMTEEYLENRMNEKMKAEAEQELYLSHVKELLSQRPSNHRCFLENIICIDYDGSLALCCASDRGCENYIWGSIFDIKSLKELKSKRQEILKCNTCEKCRALGIDYWMEYNPLYREGDADES